MRCSREVSAKFYIQCIAGNMSNLKYHVSGLQQLVDMRGGLDNLGMNGLLKRLIQMSGFLLICAPYIMCDSLTSADTSGSLKSSTQNPALCPL